LDSGTFAPFGLLLLAAGFSLLAVARRGEERSAKAEEWTDRQS
jgi:hypothetical protein